MAPAKNPYIPPVNLLVVNPKDRFYKRYWTLFLRWLFSLATHASPEAYRQHGAVSTTRALDAAFAALHENALAETANTGEAVVPAPERMTVSTIVAQLQSLIKAKRVNAQERTREAEGIVSAADSIRRAAIAAANSTFEEQSQVAAGITDTAKLLVSEAAEAEAALETILGKV